MRIAELEDEANGLAAAVELYYKPAVESLEQECRIAESRVQRSENDAEVLSKELHEAGRRAATLENIAEEIHQGAIHDKRDIVSEHSQKLLQQASLHQATVNSVNNEAEERHRIATSEQHEASVREIQVLRASLRDIQSKMNELRSAHSQEVQSLQNRMEGQMGLVQYYADTVTNDKDSTVASLKAEILRLTDRLAETHREVVNQERYRRTQEAMVNGLKKSDLDKEKELERLRLYSKFAEDKVKKLRIEIETLRAATGVSDQEVYDLRQERDDYHNEVYQTRDRVEFLEQENEFLQQEVQQCLGQFHASERKVLSAEKAIECLRQEARRREVRGRPTDRAQAPAAHRVSLSPEREDAYLDELYEFGSAVSSVGHPTSSTSMPMPKSKAKAKGESSQDPDRSRSGGW